MSFRTCIDKLNKHFNEHVWYYLISILFLATGMILGLYCVKYMGVGDKTTLINYITSVSNSDTLSEMSTQAVFFGTLKNHLPIIIGFWILGLTIIGLPIIAFLDIYKGFSLGFTFSFFIYGLKQKGILLSLLGVLPQNIIYIPCIILLSVFSMEYSVNMFREKFNIGRVTSNETNVMSFSMSMLIVTLVMGIGFIMEAFITPGLLKFALKGI